MNKGQWAEQIAAKYFLEQGFAIVAQNFHCRYGELDILTTQQDLLVAVEVRLRSSRAYGGASASVGFTKQKKIILTTSDFLQQHPDYESFNVRFDVITFSKMALYKKNKDLPASFNEKVFNIHGEIYSLEHIKAAFLAY